MSCPVCSPTSNPYRDAASVTKEEVPVQQKVVKCTSPRLQKAKKFSVSAFDFILDILAGIWVFGRWVVGMGCGGWLATVGLYRLGRWTCVQLGWDSPTDWLDSPAPTVNWFIGAAMLLGWIHLASAGSKYRKQRSLDHNRLDDEP